MLRLQSSTVKGQASVRQGEARLLPVVLDQSVSYSPTAYSLQT